MQSSILLSFHSLVFYSLNYYYLSCTCYYDHGRELHGSLKHATKQISKIKIYINIFEG